MFANLLRGWVAKRKYAQKKPMPGRRATLRLESLEERCLLSAPAIGNLSSHAWTEGAANFTGTMTISGGTAPFKVVSDSGLPVNTAASINGSVIGFTGTPTVAKSFNASIIIEDATGAEATKNFTIAVDPALIVGNLTQNQWTIGESGFNGTMTIGGGTGPFTLTSPSGLPAGLSAALNGNTIHFTGIPTAAGPNANGSVTITDADGATVMQQFSITINAAPTLSPFPVSQWTAREPGFLGVITINGGTGPYSVASYGNLPLTPQVGGNTVFFTGPAAGTEILTGGFITIRDATGAAVTETFPPFTLTCKRDRQQPDREPSGPPAK